MLFGFGLFRVPQTLGLEWVTGVRWGKGREILWSVGKVAWKWKFGKLDFWGELE
jgi:hypothetical protein